MRAGAARPFRSYGRIAGCGTVGGPRVLLVARPQEQDLRYAQRGL